MNNTKFATGCSNVRTEALRVADHPERPQAVVGSKAVQHQPNPSQRLDRPVTIKRQTTGTTERSELAVADGTR